MKKSLLFILLVVSSLIGVAQIKIINTNGFGTTDYTNATMTVYGNASDIDIVAYVYIINTSTQSMTLACRRTETDVVSGTFNSTCWSICPADVQAGVEPVQVINLSGTVLTEVAAATDTIKSFAGHYKPSNIDGCSLMKYEFFEESNPSVTLGFVNVRFIHTTGQCSVGLNEFESSLEMSMYPNPANERTMIEVIGAANNSKNLTLELTDLLGKVQLSESLNTKHEINTAVLKNGIYFVSVKHNGELIKTTKLVVRH